MNRTYQASPDWETENEQVAVIEEATYVIDEVGRHSVTLGVRTSIGGGN